MLGVMDPNIMVIGWIIKLKVMESIVGLMGE